MPDAYDEIIKILADVEAKNKIPAGTLKSIYETENAVVHMRVRDNIHDHLQGLVSNAAGKMNQDAV